MPTPLLMLFAYDITDEEIMHGLEPWFDLRNDVVGELSLSLSLCVLLYYYTAVWQVMVAATNTQHSLENLTIAVYW